MLFSEYLREVRKIMITHPNTFGRFICNANCVAGSYDDKNAIDHSDLLDAKLSELLEDEAALCTAAGVKYNGILDLTLRKMFGNIDQNHARLILLTDWIDEAVEEEHSSYYCFLRLVRDLHPASICGASASILTASGTWALPHHIRLGNKIEELIARERELSGLLSDSSCLRLKLVLEEKYGFQAPIEARQMLLDELIAEERKRMRYIEFLKKVRNKISDDAYYLCGILKLPELNVYEEERAKLKGVIRSSLAADGHFTIEHHVRRNLGLKNPRAVRVLFIQDLIDKERLRD